MNSAGSIRASKSLGNLVSVTDEQEIYTDPDKIIEDVSLLNLANKRYHLCIEMYLTA